MRSRPPCIFEPLESRRLFSAAAPIVALPTAHAGVALKLPTAGTGVTLNLQASVAFTGQVAFIPTSASSLSLRASATIDWGDGTTTAATLQAGTQAGVNGYLVIGTHAYTDPGTYSIVTQMLLTPIPQPGGPAPTFIVVEPEVVSTANVAPTVSPSTTTTTTGSSPTPTPVVIHEVAGEKFTADLGSFVTLAPGTHLKANIKWGNGKTSVGTLVASGVVGLDEINFDVKGTHKYTRLGAYTIKITVVRMPVGHSLAIPVIARLTATANVAAPPPK